MSDHQFPYRWNLRDGYPAKDIKPNRCKVFGTFICGGGSTMGYKLAGFDHIGGIEIDPKISAAYKANHRPKYLYVEDIRQFNQREDLPDELYELDILDGSPPCSTFSMSGSREKGWGKQRVFREGQVMQTLDDLVYIYCDTIAKLMPKVFLLENVRGIIQGNAKRYSKEIVRKMEQVGYTVQVFLLNAASMGVPQKRERVFFIGHRKEFDLPRLVLAFDEKPIRFGEVMEKGCKSPECFNFPDSERERLKLVRFGDRNLTNADFRLRGGNAFFNQAIVYNNQVCGTITGQEKQFCFTEKRRLSNHEVKLCGTFPLDYDFKDVEPKYLIGMSVPPVMTAQIANQIWLQWLSKISVRI